MSAGKTVRLFLADGTPGGLLTAEIMNWTGHVVAAPRSDLAALMARPETHRTGLYILIGDNPEAIGKDLVYIGEGDEVRKRLYQHARPEGQGGKDFWDRAIVLTSKDANLTKAHARYLEGRFITLGLRVNRAKLLNSTNPSALSLPEADESDMEYFIEQATIVLPVLGINTFRSAAAAPDPTLVSEDRTGSDRSPVFELRFKGDGIVATAHEVDGEFTVHADSTARRQWVGTEDHNYRSLRAQLEEEGSLLPSQDNQTMYFPRDYVFSAPSAAAAMVLGRNANGRTEWRVQASGLTYADWQLQGVEEPIELETEE